MNKHSHPQWFASAIARGVAVTVLVIMITDPVLAASSWSPTLLVNTESFQTIDEGDSTTNIVIRFGQTLLETITFNRTKNYFQFSKGISVLGTISGSTLNIDRNATFGANITASGSLKVLKNISGASLTVDKNASISGALLVKGNIATKENVSGASLTFMNGNSYILGNLGVGKSATANTKLEVAGTISGSTVYAAQSLRSSGAVTWEGQGSGAALYIGGTFDGAGLSTCNSASQKLAWNSTTKRFECGTDLNTGTQWSSTGALQLQFDNRYVNTSGDTMTGALTINVTGGGRGTTGLNVINTISGAVVHAEKTLTSSGNLVVVGNIKGKSNISGSTLTVDGNATFHGLTYSFPTTQAANAVLKTDGAGNLTWSSSVLGAGSGNIISMHPEYPNAVYFASGSSAVGQLFGSGGSAGREHVYRWTSSKTTANDYWIGVRVRVPDNFSSWSSTKPIELRYRTGSGQVAGSYLTVKMLDTNGNNVPLTGGANLVNTSYTTASITGPNSSGTFAKEGYFNIYIKLAASTTQSTSWFAEAGFLNLNWLTTAP